jgi:site-specific DNA recombinase
MKPVVPKPQRCAIYTRKSSEHNLDLEFNSLDAQREACESYIKSQAHEGWCLVPRLLMRSLDFLSAGKDAVEFALEGCRCFDAIDHDKIIVLALLAARGEIRATRAQ